MWEDKDTLKFSEALNGRVFSYNEEKSIDKIELELLGEVFKKDEKFVNKFDYPKNIQVVDRNTFYDSFSFDHDGKKYLMKFGDEIDKELFLKEEWFLKTLEKCQLVPQFFLSNSTEDYSYLITSYENAPSIREAGTSEVITNLQNFSKCLRNIHLQKTEKESQIQEFLEFNFTQTEFENILDKENFDLLKDLKIFSKCEEIIERLKNTINYQMESFFEVNQTCCHLNINESTVLVREGIFKFLNFDNAFVVDPMWDIAITSIQLKLTELPIQESQFLNYYDEENFLFNKKRLEAFKDVAWKLMLHNLIKDFFYQVFIPVSESRRYRMLFLYETLRPFMNREFPGFNIVLDDIFGKFEEQI